MIFMLSFFLMASPVSAHPGRTDKNGGHTCKTNCSKWGYEQGEYHYHNGGSNSSSKEKTPSTSVEPAGPTAAEIAKVEKNKGHDEGYEKGLSEGYKNLTNSSEVDGTDAYIEGYKQGYTEGYQEGKNKLDREKDKGHEEGYKKGLSDGYDGLTNSSEVDGTDAYIEGYKEGYNKGYEEGKEQLDKEKKDIKNEGYDLGIISEEITIPEKYQNNSIFKEEFEKGFKAARLVIFEREKKATDKLGYENGLSNIKGKPEGLNEKLLTVYNKAYELGQEELKNQYFEIGYTDAYKKLEYEKPDFEDDDLVAWYKEGFISNDEIDDIQELAFEMGKNGEELEIFEGYEQAEFIFKHYYDLGANERKENFMKVGGFTGLIAL